MKNFLYKFCYSCIRFFRNDILISGWLYPVKFKFPHNNFGDDINVPLIEEISGRHVSILYNMLFCKREHLLPIGSIIEGYCNKYSIIWGSGALYGKEPLKELPRKVCAVRGKYTRDYLMQQGIECPEIYGDPALLLPMIYAPMCQKKYKLGIVAHYSNFEQPHVQEFSKRHPEVRFIKMRGYESWKSVIDEFCSCEMIASDSLHGLIVSDAYKIPNVWVQLSSKGLLGGFFKFKDYFSGVGREYKTPVDWTKNINLDDINENLTSYREIDFNTGILLESFPYKIKTHYLNNE